MRKKNRKYTEEFKRRAVDLAESLGNTSEASRQLGIDNSNIVAWRDRIKGRQVSEPVSRLPGETERDELARLRRENSELKKVNHILKAAAAFFSQDHLK